MFTRRLFDVVVVGAGMVGAACAFYAARSGLSVAVVDRGPVAGGTTGAGEGNLLVSDKEPGPELELALLSTRLWRELAEEFPGAFEYEAKGGLVVAARESGLKALRAFAAAQAGAGVRCEEADRLADLEPHLSPDLAGGIHYPQDSQVQPALAAAHLLKASGATLHLGTEVVGVLRGADGSVRGVRTPHGDIPAGAVVNAAGTWGGQLAQLASVTLPVLPRRGFVLVTEPLPRIVRRKVYAADYVADVASGSAALQTSAVVEGTAAGPVLIGASRERVGFDRSLSVEVLQRLARQAGELFPVLRGVRVMRTYHGFRPYLPDHLPAIGPDTRAPGLWHACGHEGAGVGLAPVTGALIAAGLVGRLGEWGKTGDAGAPAAPGGSPATNPAGRRTTAEHVIREGAPAPAERGIREGSPMPVEHPIREGSPTPAAAPASVRAPAPVVSPDLASALAALDLGPFRPERFGAGDGGGDGTGPGTAAGAR